MKKYTEEDFLKPISKMQFDGIDDYSYYIEQRDAYLNKKSDLEAAKLKLEMVNRDEFAERIKNAKEQEYVKDLLGSYSNAMPQDFAERYNNFVEMVDILRNRSNPDYVKYNNMEDKHIKKGQTFSTSVNWANKLKQKGKQLFNYMEKIGKEPNISFSNTIKDTDLQALMFSQYNDTKGNPKKDGTIQQIKDLYQCVNVIENLFYNTDVDYSSNIKTRAELDNFEVIKKAPKVPKDCSSAKALRGEDSAKIIDAIYKRNKGDFNNSPNVHVLEFLVNKYGIRKDTAEKLTINDIDMRTGYIKVRGSKNKSGVDYIAKPLAAYAEEYGGGLVSEAFPEANIAPTKEDLGQIIQRAMTKNYNKLDENGEIPLVTGRKSLHYNEINRLYKNAGLDLDYYKGNKFHGDRRLFAQTLWDYLRTNVYTANTIEDKKKVMYIVNEAIGHSKKELGSLKNYVANMW